MITVNVTITPENPSRILVHIAGVIRNPRGLNAALASRLADELTSHFRTKNQTPNKLGGIRTNFWNELADQVAVTGVSDTGAIVTVADHRLQIHVEGGIVKPKKAKALTIPLIPEAHGLRASSYEKQFGKKLFTIPGRSFLYERTNAGTESLVEQTMVRVRGNKGRVLTIPLRARNQIRAVYRLARSSKIPKDPDALPAIEVTRAALTEEANYYFAREQRRLK